jgi:hypothetical protein
MMERATQRKSWISQMPTGFLGCGTFAGELSLM